MNYSNGGFQHGVKSKLKTRHIAPYIIFMADNNNSDRFRVYNDLCIYAYNNIFQPF